MSPIYKFQAEVWIYPGLAAWHFITLPIEQAAEIKATYAALKRGWGSLPIIATIGGNSWKTSIFPDKKSNSYLLPLKAAIRKKANILSGQNIEISLQIDLLK